MPTETHGRIEYELDANGKRTGRWRPRDGAAQSWKPAGRLRGPVTQKWRPGKAKAGQEPAECDKPAPVRR
jgi:hypothetical protein